MESTILSRFLHYIAIDTQSRDEMDVHSYVYATIPDSTSQLGILVLGLVAHMDTSPAYSGTGVKPRIVKNYDGGDILMAMELQSMLSVFENPMYYTEGYEGFYHLDAIGGNVEEAKLDYIIRDHDMTNHQNGLILNLLPVFRQFV